MKEGGWKKRSKKLDAVSSTLLLKCYGFCDGTVFPNMEG